MHILTAIILIIVNAGFLAVQLLGLPGNWLMVAATAVVAWLIDRSMFSVWTLVAVIALAVIGEVLEFVAGAATTKKAGSTKRGAVGALLGGVIGAFAGTILLPIPIVGTLLGASGGAFAGALLMELHAGRPMDQAVRLGVSAGKGQLLGTALKLGAGILMWLIIAIAAFWP